MVVQALPVAAVRQHPIKRTTTMAPCCLVFLSPVHLLPQTFHEILWQADLWRNEIRRPALVAESLPA